MSIKDFSKILT